MTKNNDDFSGLKALFFNGTLKKSPETSNTDGLIKVSRDLMESHGVKTELIRTIDHDIATGVYPDMREYGWKSDEWPRLYEKVQAADILVVAGLATCCRADPVQIVAVLEAGARGADGHHYQ